MKKKFKDLNQAFDELIKSSELEDLDEDEKEEEVPEEVEDTEELKESEDLETEDEATEEPIEETEEVAEEETTEEPEEEEVEDVEDDSDYMEMDDVVEEVTNRIMDNVKEYIDEQIHNIKEPDEDVEDLTGVVEKSLNVMKSLFDRIENLEKIKEEENEEVFKSLNEKVDNLDKLVKSRRSVSNIKEVVERFEKSNKLEDLTKSQAAEILSKAYQAGNRNISLADITNAELGKHISTGAIEALKNSLND